VLLAVAIGSAFLLICDLMFTGPRVWIYSGVVWAVIVALWFLRPLSRFFTRRASGP
jgi:hypothetical protein